MNNTKLNARALPSFIDYFNGIYGFATGIKDIMNMIFKTDTGGGNLTLDEILKNQDLLNQISDKLDGINGDLGDLIAQGNLNSELTKELLKIANEQNLMLNNVNAQLNSINATLNTYLPKITSMLNEVMKQNYVLSLQIEFLSKQLQEISDKLDIINLNVLINSTLTEITPAYQRIKYVNDKFDELTSTVEKNPKINQDNFTEDVIDNLTDLTELARSVTRNDMDSFEFYIKTFHDVMIGNNLFSRSALKTASELIAKENIHTRGSEIGNVYTFMIVLTSLQAKAFLTLTTCRKLLGLADIDYTQIMNENLDREKEEFRLNILPTLSNDFSNPNYTETLGSDLVDPIVTLEAEPGYALIGFEILNDPLPVLKVYQAKLKPNYQVDKESIMENIYGNIHKLLCPKQREQKYYIKDMTFPEGYVITKIVFEKKLNLLGYEVTANLYDPFTGSIDLNKTILESWKEDCCEEDCCEEDCCEEDCCEELYKIIEADTNGVYMPLGVISETFLTPIYSFKLIIDEKTKKISLAGKSYLRESLLATDLVNKETNLIPSPNGFISSIVQNWHITSDNIEPWKANNKNAYVDKTDAMVGFSSLYTHKDGEFLQFIGAKLKAKTEYIIQYTVKGNPEVYLKNNKDICYEDKTNNFDTFQTITKKFNSGVDPSEIYLVFKNQIGYEAWGNNFIILEIKSLETLPQILKPENWIPLGNAEIKEDGKIEISGNGSMNQYIQLEQNSKYHLRFSVKGKGRVTMQAQTSHINVPATNEEVSIMIETTRLYGEGIISLLNDEVENSGVIFSDVSIVKE
ncbi:vegetative insecticidal protein Vip3A family protein [Bacillus thuringiensis]|nr:vegetative insecticidal protein Vip3A family protein [Bacillus thuringiensis]MEB9327371.1 vegetative insecticidal protein Vip3A family protein [Bacillus cereus]MCR6789916.1 vegetative insecticidal protein Vip3A family protein [Bacillus thuringiensis]MCR6825896.1 vegetative insecticidal protein Vip3A family protein [Bacillus thuringiensis]MCR6831748.1 vegetative insecticidal protein Vip3A family protein [Bacillus thuringiensis]MEC3239919.1 vegetative insecticidal protein Vip3A family protein